MLQDAEIFWGPYIFSIAKIGCLDSFEYWLELRSLVKDDFKDNFKSGFKDNTLTV